jgi:hypothetical protein
VVLLQGLLLHGGPGRGLLLHDLLDGVGERGVEVVGVERHLAQAVKAAPGRDALTVGAHRNAPDATLHGGELADEVGIVPDLAVHQPVHAVDLRLSVRAPDDDLVALGMAGNGGDPPLERAGRDRGDVVHEPLGGDLDELGGAVAVDGDQVGAVLGPDRAQGPVRVRRVEEHLRALQGVEGPHGVVGASDGDLRPVRGPTHAVDGVIADGNRERQLLLDYVPDLDLASQARAAGGDGEARPVGREPYGLDALREAHEPGHALRSVRLEEQDLMEAGDGQELPVRRDVDRRKDGRERVDGRMVRVELRPRVRGSVVHGPFLDPSADEIDLRGRERILPLGHLDLAALPRTDLLDDEAQVRLPRDDARLFRVADPQEPLVRGHGVPALRLGGLVAPEALGLEDGPDLEDVAHLVGRGPLLLLPPGGSDAREHQERRHGSASTEETHTHTPQPGSQESPVSSDTPLVLPLRGAAGG